MEIKWTYAYNGNIIIVKRSMTLELYINDVLHDQKSDDSQNLSLRGVLPTGETIRAEIDIVRSECLIFVE